MYLTVGRVFAFGCAAGFCPIVGLGFGFGLGLAEGVGVTVGVADGTLVGAFVAGAVVGATTGADCGASLATQERSPKIAAAAINANTTTSESFLYSTRED